MAIPHITVRPDLGQRELRRQASNAIINRITESRAGGAELVHLLDVNYQGRLIIRVGDDGARHPDYPGTTFKSVDYARQYITQREGKEWDGRAVAFDTRPTIHTVAALIHEIETTAYDLDRGQRSDWPHGGVWDEGLYAYPGTDPDAKWPSAWEHRWIYATVVPGGSEGLWLHVDAIFLRDPGNPEPERVGLITGKCLGHTWEECWASAARISALFNDTTT